MNTPNRSAGKPAQTISLFLFSDCLMIPIQYKIKKYKKQARKNFEISYRSTDATNSSTKLYGPVQLLDFVLRLIENASVMRSEAITLIPFDNLSFGKVIFIFVYSLLLFLLLSYFISKYNSTAYHISLQEKNPAGFHLPDFNLLFVMRFMDVAQSSLKNFVFPNAHTRSQRVLSRLY